MSTVTGTRDTSVYPFETDDGLRLTLTRFQETGRHPAAGGTVLLVHGLSMSSAMFAAPEQHPNLVDYLFRGGFGEVWALDYRISQVLPYNQSAARYTFDDIARHDYPAALRELRRHTGDTQVHVIAHCVGALTFMMSLASGLLDGIGSVVLNSVGLTPRVPPWSQCKLSLGPPLFGGLLGLPVLAARPSNARERALSRLVSLAHRQCDDPVCHMISFLSGTGRSALFDHDNLSPAVHDRIGDFVGPINTRYYRHIAKMAAAGRAVRFDDTHPELPRDYLHAAAGLTVPLLLITGDNNRVFGESNIECHRVLSRTAPGWHELAVLPGYGHLDPFIGRDAHHDVFPLIADFIARNGGSRWNTRTSS